jgi:hypothetical protein
LYLLLFLSLSFFCLPSQTWFLLHFLVLPFFLIISLLFIPLYSLSWYLPHFFLFFFICLSLFSQFIFSSLYIMSFLFSIFLSLSICSFFCRYSSFSFINFSSIHVFYLSQFQHTKHSHFFPQKHQIILPWSQTILYITTNTNKHFLYPSFKDTTSTPSYTHIFVLHFQTHATKFSHSFFFTHTHTHTHTHSTIL